MHSALYATASGGEGVGEVLFRVLGADLHGFRVVREFAAGQWWMRPSCTSINAFVRGMTQPFVLNEDAVNLALRGSYEDFMHRQASRKAPR